MLSKNSDGFFLHRLAKVVVEIREGFKIRIGALEIAQVQPLLGEVGDERLRARIGQHPLDLLLQHDRVLQLALARERQQLLVREAAPEKEGQARRQREVVQPICRFGARFGGSVSKRNRNSGLARMNWSADSIPRSNASLPLTPSRPRR